jgi:hypothetical protein
MIPPELDPDQTQVRTFFRGLAALLLLAMAGMLVYGSVPLILEPGPAKIQCPVQPRKLACELGASMVNALPAVAQRTALGVAGLAAAAGIGWVIWAFTLRKKTRG